MSSRAERRRGDARLPAAAVILALLVVGGSQSALAHDRTLAASRVPRFGLFQQRVGFTTSVANPWEQVKMAVRLTAPSGRTFAIGGFYAAPGRWEFRFAQPEAGKWTWTARIGDGTHASSQRGSFVALAEKSPGFVRRSPYNRFRWTLGSGVASSAVRAGEQALAAPPFTTDLALEIAPG
jgi:hypothetical protein